MSDRRKPLLAAALSLGLFTAPLALRAPDGHRDRPLAGRGPAEPGDAHPRRTERRHPLPDLFDRPLHHRRHRADRRRPGRGPEPPETPEVYGNAQWIKIYLTQLTREATADDLLSSGSGTAPTCTLVLGTNTSAQANFSK